MEKESITGKMDEIKGKAKQAVGNATGNSHLETEGAIDQAKGKAKQAYGDLKDAIKKTDKESGTDVNNK